MDNATIEIPKVIGASFGGGLFANRFFIGDIAYALIIAPKADGYFAPQRWNKSTKKVDGACSYNDGFANTQAMAKAGSALAQSCLDLRIGGFDDWYLMSRQEALMAFYELQNVEAFKEDGIEAFEPDWHWTSTQYAPDVGCAWCQGFYDGGQGDGHKNDTFRARAVRRLVIE